MSKKILALGAAVTLTAFAFSSRPALAGEGKSLSSVKYDGEVRVRAENVREADFNGSAETATDNDNLTIQRTRVGLTFEPTEDISQAYLQLEHTRTWGSGVLTNNAMGQDDVRLHQAYVDAKALGADVRIGRQELSYGDQRLIGAFNWSNFGRSFDGVRARWSVGRTGTLDFIGAKVNNAANTATNSNDDSTLYGLYSTWKPADNYTWDLYALLRNSRENSGAATVLPEDRWTIGTRGSGASSGWDYSGEIAFQFGTAGDNNRLANNCPVAKAPDTSCDISASALDIKGGYTWEDTASKFRLGLEYASASGDDGTDDSLDAFDNLYPTNHDKYGIYDKVINAWSNMQMFQINVGGKVSQRAWLGAAWMTFDRADPAPTTSDDLGSEIDLLYKFQRSQNTGIEVGFARFLAGNRIENGNENSTTIIGSTTDSEDSDWMYAQLTYKF